MGKKRDTLIDAADSQTAAMDVKTVTAEANRIRTESEGATPRYELAMASMSNEDGSSSHEVVICDPTQPVGDGRVVHSLTGGDAQQLRVDAETWVRDVNAEPSWRE
jgi:hypothetical protein